MKTVPGVANACSHIEHLEVKGAWGFSVCSRSPAKPIS
jgi:hypothetical protein